MDTYKDCIAEIVCKTLTAKCYLNMSQNYPGIEPLKTEIELFLERSGINEIKFKMWKTIDRSTLQTEIVSSYLFTDIFFPLLHKFKTHSYVSK